MPVIPSSTVWPSALGLPALDPLDPLCDNSLMGGGAGIAASRSAGTVASKKTSVWVGSSGQYSALRRRRLPSNGTHQQKGSTVAQFTHSSTSEPA